MFLIVEDLVGQMATLQQRLPGLVVRAVFRRREQIDPGQDLTQVGHAGHQALFVVLPSGPFPQQLGIDPFAFHTQRIEQFGGSQQLVAGLSHQGQGRGDGDVGDHVGGVFQPQAVFDQTVLAGLTHDLVEHLTEARRSQTSPEVAQRARIDQRVVDVDLQKQTKGHVGLGSLDHLAVGEVVMIAEILKLEHHHRRLRGSSYILIERSQDLMKGIPIDHLQGFPQMVIGWDVGLEDLEIERCRSKGSWIAEHERTLRSHQAKQTIHRYVRLSHYSRPPPQRPPNPAAEHALTTFSSRLRWPAVKPIFRNLFYSQTASTKMVR